MHGMLNKAFGEQLLPSERFHFAAIHYSITICILGNAGLRIKGIQETLQKSDRGRLAI
jgi:hypothetical protein